jgi:CRISPR system Cascade subunit CasA
MSPEFELRDEAWIPVRWTDGRLESLGLRQVLCNAEHIRGLECSTPLRQIALLRLLLAIAHRADRLGDIHSAIRRLSGGWPTQRLADYLDTWGHRFGLFDASAPFLQAPWLSRHEKTHNRQHSFARITSEWSTGNAKLLMDHHVDGVEYVLPVAEVAQTLVAYQQFCTGGLSKVFKDSDVGGPAMGFAHIWVTAPTLARFLTLNQTLQGAEEYAGDLPAWEQPVWTPENVQRPHSPFAGPASRYCHLTRSVLLNPSDGKKCPLLWWAEGIARTDNAAMLDPMEAQRLGKDDTWRSLRLSEDRSMWRDSQCLMVSPSARAPAVVQHAIGLLEEAGDTASVTLGIGGLLADKAKLVLWRIEQITAPAPVLKSAVLQAILAKGLTIAENAAKGLRDALAVLAREMLREDGDADKAAVHGVVDSLPGIRQYWHGLDIRFPHFLAQLDAVEHAEAALEHWRSELLEALRMAWQDSVRSAGLTRRAMLAAAKAERNYQKARTAIIESREVSQ